MPVTPSQVAIIKATVPILQTGGEALTTYFYKNMLSENPDVTKMFNLSNQAKGTQPRALAYSVLCYARNIDTLQNLGPLAAQIVNKHVALQVLPEHYPIVGKYLLKAIRDVLGADVATDDVLDAWGAAYFQLADILINAEGAAYAANAAAPGGWSEARNFKISKKVVEAEDVVSVYLSPADGKEVIRAVAGQYLGLKFLIDGKEQRRNYSISSTCDGKQLRFTVKKIPGGLVSTHVHETMQVGDDLDVFAPAGAFSYTKAERPVVLLTGGIGITPAVSLIAAARADNRPVTHLHFAQTLESNPFNAELVNSDGYTVSTTYTKQGGQRPTPASLVSQLSHLGTDFDAYIIGPKGFMKTAVEALEQAGVPKDNVKYEFFGPHEQF